MGISGIGIAGTARADVVSDKEVQCRGAAEGDACKVDGIAGLCKPSTCSRLDYSGGSPPGTVEFDCMECTPGASPAPQPEAVPPPAEPTAAKADPAAAPAAAADAKTPAANAQASGATKTDTKTDTKTEGKSGCSSGATDGGPWLLGSLVLGLGLIGLGRARR